MKTTIEQLTINDYKKQYIELKQKIIMAQKELDTFELYAKSMLPPLLENEQKRRLDWLAKHVDYLRRHKNYIKNSTALKDIVIDFVPLFICSGLVSGAGFCLCNKYKIYLGDLLDLWDDGFCYKGYPIVSCNIGIHWNTDYTIKYIKNKNIETTKESVKGQFKPLPGVPPEVFNKMRKANVAEQFYDIQPYKNIDLMIRAFK